MAFSEPKPLEGIINNRQQFTSERFKLMVESVVYERRESVLRVCKKIEKFKQKADNKFMQNGLLEMQIKYQISKQGISQQQNKKVLKTMEIKKKKLISEEEWKYINCLEEVFKFTCQALNQENKFNALQFFYEFEKMNAIVLEISQQQYEDFSMDTQKQEDLAIKLIRRLINQQQSLFSKNNDQKFKELNLEDKKPSNKENIIVHITSMHKADQLAREIFDGLDNQFVLYRGTNQKNVEVDLLDATLKARGVQVRPNHIYTQILGDWNKIQLLQELQRLIDTSRINYQMITNNLKLSTHPKEVLNSIVNLLDDCADMDKWIKIIRRHMKDLNETQTLNQDDQGAELYFVQFYKSKIKSMIEEYKNDQKNEEFLPAMWHIRKEKDSKGNEINEKELQQYLDRRNEYYKKFQEQIPQRETKFNDILFEFRDGAIYFYSEYEFRLLVQFHSLEPIENQKSDQRPFTLGQYLYDEDYWKSIIRLRFCFPESDRSAQPQLKSIQQQQQNQEDQSQNFKNLKAFFQNIKEQNQQEIQNTKEQNQQDIQRRNEIYDWILKCLVVISRKIIRRDKHEIKKQFEKNQQRKDVILFSNHSKQFEIQGFQN